MNQLRVGIIGVGNMGSHHAKTLQEGKIKGAVLAGVADADPKRLEPWTDVKQFHPREDILKSGAVDAVLVATPHYDHTTLGIAALQAGLHLLVEKPISVHKADAERLLAAYKKTRGLVFSAMFNQRTDPHYTRVRQLIQDGELGTIRRTNWIITNWFRSQAYYNSGGWRATWRGEGGGVLLNQCPHNLDLFQWLCGMPATVRAHCYFGKHHKIEVEDEVTAFLEYPNGATGLFITSTGEAPGTNRLEITGDRGKVVIEDGKVTFTRNEVPANEFLKTTKESFARPGTWDIDIPASGNGGQHTEILQNFVDAILTGKPLIAPAVEGIRSVELANAMLLSAWLDKAIKLPLDGKLYERELNKRIATSKYRKPVIAAAGADMGKSFGK
jgi:predicted dehydrogenase